MISVCHHDLLFQVTMSSFHAKILISSSTPPPPPQCFANVSYYLLHTNTGFILKLHVVNSALQVWQKEASDKSEISCKRAKCVCHFH